MSKRQLAYLALLSNAILWGIASPVIKDGLNHTSPLYFLTIRFMLVFALTTPFFVFYLYRYKIKIRGYKKLFIIGFFSNPLNLFLLFWGLNQTSALDATILASLYPVFFTTTCVLFLKEKVTKQERTGLIIALIGTLIFALQPLLSKQESGQSSVLGNFIIIVGQLVYLVAMLMAKANQAKNPPFVQAYSGWLTAFLFFTPIAWLTKTLDPRHLGPVFSIPSLPHIVYMAIFGSIVAFFAYLYGQSKIEASEAGMFTYLQPLFAAPLAVLWLGEKITPPFIIGCTFIIIGVILSETRKKIIV